MSLATIRATSGSCPHCGPALIQVIGVERRVDWHRCTECNAEWAARLGGWPRLQLHRLVRWWNDQALVRAGAMTVLWILAAVGLASTAGCATGPRIEYVDRPVVEYVDRLVYVAIPDHLVPDYPIATGPLEACPLVARDRRLELERAQANARAIRAIRGTDVPADQRPTCEAPRQP